MTSKNSMFVTRMYFDWQCYWLINTIKYCYWSLTYIGMIMVDCAVLTLRVGYLCRDFVWVVCISLPWFSTFWHPLKILLVSMYNRYYMYVIVRPNEWTIYWDMGNYNKATCSVIVMDRTKNYSLSKYVCIFILTSQTQPNE